VCVLQYSIVLFQITLKNIYIRTLILISLDSLANYFRDIKREDSQSIMNVCSRRYFKSVIWDEI